jgi:hypothetical protein
MPRLPQIATLTVLATLLAGCGSYTPYWQAFFEVGQPASATSLISHSNPGSGSLSDRLPRAITEMRGLFQEESSYIENLPVLESRLTVVNIALRDALDHPEASDGFGPQTATPPTTLMQRSAQLLSDQRDRLVLQHKGLFEKEELVLQEADSLEKICFKPTTSPLCPRFNEGLSLIRVKSEIMANGFDHLDDVYREEVKKQQEIAAHYIKK